MVLAAAALKNIEDKLGMGLRLPCGVGPIRLAKDEQPEYASIQSRFCILKIDKIEYRTFVSWNSFEYFEWGKSM